MGAEGYRRGPWALSMPPTSCPRRAGRDRVEPSLPRAPRSGAGAEPRQVLSVWPALRPVLTCRSPVMYSLLLLVLAPSLLFPASCSASSPRSGELAGELASAQGTALSVRKLSLIH